MNIKPIAALALALGVLGGCGGGGGGASADGKTPSTDAGSSSVLNSGIYLDTTHDLALALLPEQSAKRAWFGLRPTTSSPVIYRGQWTAGSNATARSFVAASYYDGTATWTASTASRLTGTLAISPTDPNTSVTANQVVGLSASELNGSRWQGAWTLNAESASYAAGQAFALTAIGTSVSADITRFLGCKVTATLTTRAEAGLYDAALAFANDPLDTGRTCGITTPMTGLLMAYTAGSSRYLRLVAFDSGNTQSVSFRGALP